MQRITVDVQFVTPCFLGGADPKQTAEWRAESIRGQLRWWFRAVAARHFGFDSEPVRAAEEEVWGSTTRKSAVDIVVEPLKEGALQPKGVPFMNTAEGYGKGTINGPVYLGYGLFDLAALPNGKKGFRTSRPYIQPGTEGRFHIIRRGAVTQHEIDALRSWICLGGIGSRSRRGWGSVSLVGVSGIDPHKLACTLPDVVGSSTRRRIDTDDALGQLPESPALSDYTRVCRWNQAFEDQSGVEGWRKALHAAGKALIDWRRRYKQGSPPTLDYEWAYGQKNELGLPHRVGFGLPLPFGPPLLLRGVDHDRRASPLLIHIEVERSGGRVKYRPIFTFLPSRFLPAQEQVAFFRKQGDHYVPSKGVFSVGLDQWRIVQGFFDDLTSGATALATEVV
ncbi:MAG: type III-B CRISPR module RAMP protein Cmr1 [Thermoanaerobaculia bacterium]